MAQCNVSSCVLSIIASFSSGLDVFRQLTEKRRRRDGRRRSKSQRQFIDEEAQLTRSLRQGQEDIGREYQKNLEAAGEHFSTGDGKLLRPSVLAAPG